MSDEKNLKQFSAQMGGDHWWGSADPAPFDADFKYQTTHPPAAVERENYFLGYRNHFARHRPIPGTNRYQTGDKIHVTCRADDGTWEKATLEVVLIDDHNIVTQTVTDWRRGGRVQSLDGLTAKYTPALGFGKWVVFNKEGKPYRKGVSKQEAEILVGHALGKQAEKEEAGAS